LESDEATAKPDSLGHWPIDVRMEFSANKWLHGQCQWGLRESSVNLHAHLGRQETRRNTMEMAPAAASTALSAPIG